MLSVKKVRGFLRRLSTWLLRLLIAFDQLLGVLVRGPFYVLGLAECPSADQTISAFTGISANAGKRWAIIAQAIIDRLFGKGHCQRAIVRDGND